MAERVVKVWYDRPGDFLEIGWGSGAWAVDTYDPPAAAELGLTVHLTEAGQATGFDILGALYPSKHLPSRPDGQREVVAQVQPHPVSVRYDRQQDRWRAQWGPAVTNCIPTPNPRIQALVDAAGQIQGVEIRDLRTFEGEILNQDLYPAELGVRAG